MPENSVTRRDVLGWGAASAAGLTAAGLTAGLPTSARAAESATAESMAAGPATGAVPVAARPAGEDVCFLSALELSDLFARRALSPVELVTTFYRRIDRLNPGINAYILLLREQAMAQARESERRIRSGRARPLEGIPIAVKDLYDFIAGVPARFGSRVFEDRPYVPAASATHVARLLDAGAIPLGKTNLPEFAYKGITDNFLYGPTSTPFDLTRNAGGSSGGSAAAAAAGLACLAQGGDAGGSVRIPAAMCGVVGFKPTFGRIPETPGPTAFLVHAPFLHLGPITRTVADAAVMTRTMAGPDPEGDPFALPDTVDYLAALRRSIAGKRVAFSPDLGTFPVEPEVAAVVEAALPAFTEAGARVERATVQLPPQERMAALWEQEMGVLDYNGVVDSFRLDGIDVLARPEVLDPDWLARTRSVEGLSARDYRAGDFLRTEVLRAVAGVFSRYDLLVTPTLSVASVLNGRGGRTNGPSRVQGVAVDPLIGWCLTYPFNFTGHPAITVPGGWTADGLPVGLQIVGSRFRDDLVLAAAAAFERRRPWRQHYRRLR